MFIIVYVFVLNVSLFTVKKKNSELHRKNIAQDAIPLSLV